MSVNSSLHIEERSNNPDAPDTNFWRFYFLLTGAYIMNTDGSAYRLMTSAANVLTRELPYPLTPATGHPATTAGCAVAVVSESTTSDVNLKTFDFDQTTQEHAEWSVWMPDDWNAGTVTAKFCWTAASGTGTVTWAIQGRSYADDDAIDQAFGTAITVTDTLLATGDIHITSATAAVTLTGAGAGELVQLRVYRDTATDNLAADALLIAVKLYYTPTP
jgi:hypothetical protein